MKCKSCSSDNFVKNGTARNQQRYKCKNCGLNFVNGDNRTNKNLSKQKMALHLYLENMGFRAIGRVLGVSNVTVLNWVKSAGEWVKTYHEKMPKPPKVEVVELDEMWHFVGKKTQIMAMGCTGQGRILYY